VGVVLGVLLVGVVLGGSCTGERELPEASFVLGKRQGDSEAQGMAGPAINPVQGFSTLRGFEWEFLRLWTGFELSSSWRALPCYGASTNRSGLDFMRGVRFWPRGTGSQRHATAKMLYKKKLEVPHHLPKKVSPIPTLKYTTDQLKALTISLF
jgi:hypothetical protein